MYVTDRPRDEILVSTADSNQFHTLIVFHKNIDAILSPNFKNILRINARLNTILCVKGL